MKDLISARRRQLHIVFFFFWAGEGGVVAVALAWGDVGGYQCNWFLIFLSIRVENYWVKNSGSLI